MDWNLGKDKEIVDIINKQIFNINWDNKSSSYETRNFSSDLNSEIGRDVGIVIDNGSYECRAGWSFSEEPNIKFRSIVAKPKVQTKDQTTFLVGNEMLGIEQGKLHKKSPFEKNYVAHFGTQEHLLDHIFYNLNIKSSRVDHPITFTEPLCNLNWSRKNLSEMMFELYSVPSLCYGVDMMYSLHYNKNKINNRDNCLIISSSYQSTHIVPILNGRINIDKTRRINIASFHANEMLTKSLHLRFPDLKNKFTSDIVQEIQEKYTMCAKDYRTQVGLLQGLFEWDQEKLREEEKKRMFGSLEMYEKANFEEISQKRIEEKKHKHIKKYRNFINYENEIYDLENGYESNLITDLVFFEWPRSSSEVVLSEEEMRRKQEIRKEQSKRLRELMQKKREENMKTLEKELHELEQIAALKNHDKYQFEEALLSKGFSSQEELEKRMNHIFMKINFNKENKEEEKVDEDKRWPFVNIPDEDLTEEQQKMKKIQRMQKQAYLNRLEKREKQKREKEKVEELKQQDPENYLVSLYRKKKELMDKLEKYKQIRKDITSRYSKVNRGRMLMLAELGKEGTSSAKKGDTAGDDFGTNDEDWEVYRGISRHNLSEEEEEDQQQLQEIEAQIIEVDPNYFKYSEANTQGFMYNTNHFSLGVDQFRGAELLFQPHIIGVDQAGLSEILVSVFKTMTYEEQMLLAGNIFITGGNAKTKYLRDRIYNDLRANLDCSIEINISVAEDPELDAWKGAKLFSNNPDNERYYVTRQEYFENGPDYYKEHYCGNNSIGHRGSNLNYDTSNKKAKLI